MTKFSLRDYQADSVRRTLNWLSTRECNPLIVMPTASGKSLVIAELCRRIKRKDPDGRIIIATHVKELVEQNYAELKRWWPECDAGICSAGLKREDFKADITVGTIQTLYLRAWAFGDVRHIIIDEAHMIPRAANSRYQKMLRSIEIAAKTKVPIIGLTATPYRLDSGFLHQGDDAIFDLIAANVPITKLIHDKHLVPLVNKVTATQIDTSRMLRNRDDFTTASMQVEVERQQISNKAINEITKSAAGRKSWLVFAVSIKHATELKDALNASGIPSRTVSSETPREERDQIIQAFRDGAFTALVSVNILTTGFNVPEIDLIALLRPTLSTALYVQMLGRGMRTAKDKSDCLVLDFGGNIERHGPINNLAIQVEAPIDVSGEGEMKTKICPTCEKQMLVVQRTCSDCGHLFTELSSEPDCNNAVLDLTRPEPEQPMTPREILKSYLRVKKVGSDPFIEHLMNLKSRSHEAA